jgi:predicted porin
MASYIKKDDRLGGGLNQDADQYAIGAIYNLSKRTNVYTSYGKQNDKSALNLDQNLFQVGLQHRF